MQPWLFFNVFCLFLCNNYSIVPALQLLSALCEYLGFCIAFLRVNTPQLSQLFLGKAAFAMASQLAIDLLSCGLGMEIAVSGPSITPQAYIVSWTM